MKKSIFLVLGVFYSANLIAAESVYDGTGSLINPNEQCWGCDRDEARMHPHENKNSTVTFQWLHHASMCEHIDISSNVNLDQDVLINLKSWDNQQIETSYKAKLPVQDGSGNGISLQANHNWTTLSISTTQSLNKMVQIFAYCKSPADTLNTQDLTTISTSMTKLEHGRYYLGNGSLISTSSDNGASGFGTIQDAAVTSDSYDAETTFQIQSSKGKCEEITVYDHGNSKSLDAILVKGWSESTWKPHACSELPCKVKAYFNNAGGSAYSIINVHTKAGNNGTLVATCGQKSTAINLNEKETKLRHPNGCKFDDVPTSHWGHKYITALCSSQIVVGYEHTDFTKYGPDNPTLWSELTAVVNLSNNFYQTKKIRNGYPKEPWYQAYIEMASKQGFNESSQTEVTRGNAFKYVINVFWNKKNLSGSQAASFLKGKGVINSENISNKLTRAELAKVVLNSSRISASEIGVERKLPYINHIAKDVDLNKKVIIPIPTFETAKPNDSLDKKKEMVNKNKETAVKENNTVSEKGHTDNAGLFKAIAGGVNNIKEEYKNKTGEDMVKKMKEKGIIQPVDENNKIKPDSVVILKLDSGKELPAHTTNNVSSDGNANIILEDKERGVIEASAKDLLNKANIKIQGQTDVKKVLEPKPE